MKTDNIKTLLAQTGVVKPVEPAVYPSEQCSVLVQDDEEYGGAHTYHFVNCLGFADGETQYIKDPLFDRSGDVTMVQFVKKLEDGTVIPGVQNEQLVIAMLDRLEKMHRKFPHPANVKMSAGLQMYLEAARERVDERIKRGVMDELKK